jgi:hypothetical protein
MITTILIVIFIELIFRPRIDVTKEKDILLWYGRNKRNYIKIL